MPAEMTGIEAVRQKNEWWFDNYPRRPAPTRAGLVP
jgi:hypothetical protein